MATVFNDHAEIIGKLLVLSQDRTYWKSQASTHQQILDNVTQANIRRDDRYAFDKKAQDELFQYETHLSIYNLRIAELHIAAIDKAIVEHATRLTHGGEV